MSKVRAVRSSNQQNYPQNHAELNGYNEHREHRGGRGREGVEKAGKDRKREKLRALPQVRDVWLRSKHGYGS